MNIDNLQEKKWDHLVGLMEKYIRVGKRGDGGYLSFVDDVAELITNNWHNLDIPGDLREAAQELHACNLLMLAPNHRMKDYSGPKTFN